MIPGYDMFCFIPRRESVLMRPLRGNTYWMVTSRWLWLCRARRVDTAWGETYYVRAEA